MSLPASGVPRLGPRVHAVVVVVLLAGLVAVVAWTVSTVARQHERLLELAAAERASQLDDAVARVAEDFEDIAADLAFFAELVDRSPDDEAARRSLAALLGSVRRYREAAVSGPDCEPRLVVRDPRWSWGADSAALGAALDDTTRRACRDRSDSIVVSRPLEDDELRWFRVFARPVASGAVALVVDTAPLLDWLRTVTADASAELLVLGPYGGAAPVTALRPAEGLQTGASPTLLDVVARMRAGGSGTVVIPRAEAVALGYPDAELLAVFQPIPVADGPGWSAATLVSAEGIVAHERSLALRLLGGAAGGTLLLALLALYAVRVARGEAAATERLRSAEHVAHLRERAERILDHVPSGVAALRGDGAVTAVNVTLRRWAGEEESPTLATLFARAGDDALGRIHGLVDRALATGHVHDLTAERLPLFGREGTYTLRAVPIVPSTSEVSVLLVVDDLTELRTLQDQLLRTEKLATVGVLAAGIAHEVGTPLGVIRGRAEVVARKLGPGHAQAGGLQVIVEQIDRITRTIRALLDFATPRPAAGAEVDLRVPIGHVVDLVRYEAEKRRVRLAIAVDPDVPPVRADADHVQQILVNLVMNAFDAVAAEGSVRVAARGADGAVILSVSDDGCGIPPESLHQVFDPFFTTKKRGHGTGLGLAVVNQLARIHGGVVRIESDPGRGTLVEVRLPPGRR